ncbi:MAG: argininosuccinate synthase [Candidatus Diapherotrites archaeon]|nr:argininosuccinate synthase [Candidatus Diapherotrites archaeon]
MDLVEKIKSKIDVGQYDGVEKVVLAYSGGVDTSVMIPLIQEVCGAEVVAVTVGLGQDEYNGSGWEKAKEKAESLGAKHYFFDATEEFVEGPCWQAVKANCLYQGSYPNSTALGRPIIVEKLVEAAKKEGADALAHGCTGKGNDQVRFDICTHSLMPDAKIIAPVRDWNLGRDEEIAWAEGQGIHLPVKAHSPYSVDSNIWGKSSECGPLEDPSLEPPEDVFDWVALPEDAPDVAETVTVKFEGGKPIGGVGLLEELNALGAKHGIGIIDAMEDRTIGLKSREVYECPGSTLLLNAHKDLEKFVFTKEENQFKPFVDKHWAETVYYGLWFNPVMDAMNAFIDESQKKVTGEVTLKLFKGHAKVVGRKSGNAIYDHNLITYSSDSGFDQLHSHGFIKLWGLNTVTAKKVMA